jgi:hypothetical protein
MLKQRDTDLPRGTNKEHHMTKPLHNLILAASMLAAGGAGAVTCSTGPVTLTVGIAPVICDPGGSGRTITDFALLSGGGVLSFSNGGIGANGLLASGAKPSSVSGLVAALNVGKVELNPLDGSEIVQSNVLLGNGRSSRGIISIGAKVTGLTADGTTGQIQNVYAAGGAEQVAGYLQDVLDGGRVTVRNLRFDLDNHAVYADMTGQSLQLDGTYSPLQTANNLKLWTYDAATSTGPTVLSPAGLLAAAYGDLSILQGLGYQFVNQGGYNPYVIIAHDEFKNLLVTQEGFDFFANSLGLSDPTSLGYSTLQGVNSKAGGWGSITSDLVFGSVPEPGTYALLGLGLVGIALVAQRRKLAA